MVGGGIGVTPYASILNDLVFGTSTNRYSGVSCKKASKSICIKKYTADSYLKNHVDKMLKSAPPRVKTSY